MEQKKLERQKQFEGDAQKRKNAYREEVQKLEREYQVEKDKFKTTLNLRETQRVILQNASKARLKACTETGHQRRKRDDLYRKAEDLHRRPKEASREAEKAQQEVAKADEKANEACKAVDQSRERFDVALSTAREQASAPFKRRKTEI